MEWIIKIYREERKMMQNSQEQKRMPLIENRTLCLTIC